MKSIPTALTHLQKNYASSSPVDESNLNTASIRSAGDTKPREQKLDFSFNRSSTFKDLHSLPSTSSASEHASGSVRESKFSFLDDPVGNLVSNFMELLTDKRYRLPQIASRFRRHTLVTRWANYPRESASENHRYGHFMADSIESAAKDLRGGDINNLDQLWQRASLAREDAFVLKTMPQKDQSLPTQLDEESEEHRVRCTQLRQATPLGTYIEYRYGYITSTILEKARELFAHPTPGTSNQWQKEGYTLLCKPYSTRNGKDFNYRLLIPSKNALSKREKQHTKLSSQIGWYIKVKNTNKNESDFAGAMPIENLLLINLGIPQDSKAQNFSELSVYKSAQRACEQVLDAVDQKDVLRHAFTCYRELVIAAPNMRGTAAKSHYVLQTLLLAKGIDLPPAKYGIAPDLEAMARDDKDWQSSAPNFFAPMIDNNYLESVDENSLNWMFDLWHDLSKKSKVMD